MHFQTWHDKAGNAPPLTDPTAGLVFPDLSADGELLQTNPIRPKPTISVDPTFPTCPNRPPDRDPRRRYGRGPSPDRRRVVHRAVTGVFCPPQRAGQGCRRRPPTQVVTT